jgi:uncharacterized membrane protein
VTTSYPRIAGQNLDRLSALSDGIFAVAMTLLVLDLRVPVSEAIHGEHPLWTPGAFGAESVAWDGLAQLAPRLLPYVMSFLTLGIFWVGQQTQLNHFTRADRRLTWINLVFLAAVTLMPFSTGFLAEYITYRVPFVVYWLNLLLLGTTLLMSLRHAVRAGLLDPSVTEPVRATLERRIIAYQSLYTGAMLVSVVNTYASIVALVVLQLMSVIAPPVWPFNRI